MDIRQLALRLRANYALACGKSSGNDQGSVWKRCHEHKADLELAILYLFDSVVTLGKSLQSSRMVGPSLDRL